ncbi:MAG TPA: trypsin-like peptidase domain-containing protein [Bryobacteraceae bacterium]|nr:trypsin-like peptidase domain-containing protein [Bryobacteraceae bacterium]
MFKRILILAAVILGGFYLLTSVTHWNPRDALAPVRDAGGLWTQPDHARSAGLSADELNNIEVYKTAHNATVNITTVVYREDWFFRLVPVEGSGSGFIVNAEGQIVTNNHVVSGGRQIKVILADKSTYEARVLFNDEANDLALLKITPRKKLPFLRLGDSDQLQVGQKVLAIGNPFGLEGTLTTGVISSLNRTIQAEANSPMEDMIQTDAAINPGNSGGPLLDTQGNVIGINTMIVGAANIGIGFAIPINRAKWRLDDYQARGRYARPYLGIRSLYVSGELAEALDLPAEGGLLVISAERSSPAESAGLRGARRRVVVGNYEIPVGGDLIMAVDGQAVDGNTTLERAKNRKRVGEALNLTIYRDGRTMKVKVTLGEAPEQRL